MKGNLDIGHSMVQSLHSLNSDKYVINFRFYQLIIEPCLN